MRAYMFDAASPLTIDHLWLMPNSTEELFRLPASAKPSQERFLWGRIPASSCARYGFNETVGGNRNSGIVFCACCREGATHGTRSVATSPVGVAC
jgi:hypothetical protein